VEDEGWRMRKDGTRFWADVILTPLFTDGRQLRGFAKVTRDMTEKRIIMDRMEEALSASRAKSAFLANMSHELRTPLNAIIGYAEMLDEQIRETSPELSHDMSKIIYSSRHLLSIISDVLDLSKIEAGHLDLKFESVDVVELINEVVASAKPLADKNGNSVHVSTVAGTIIVESDPLRLRQVLYNLFSNAAKFTQNGRIDLSATVYKGELEIQITDTGIGMTESQANRIFNMFYRVDVKDQPEGQGGTGLGLAISRLLCEAMGGTISVTSVQGKGSTFTIRLPRYYSRPTQFG
jgi:signal transduction histidine kinase